MTRFELYKDQRGEWRWRLKADNHEIVAVSSEGYQNRSDAQHGIELVRKDEGKYEIYDDQEGQARWRFIHTSNGNIIATAGQGYHDQQAAERGMDAVRRIAPDAPIETTD